MRRKSLPRRRALPRVPWAASQAARSEGVRSVISTAGTLPTSWPWRRRVSPRALGRGAGRAGGEGGRARRDLGADRRGRGHVAGGEAGAWVLGEPAAGRVVERRE